MKKNKHLLNLLTLLMTGLLASNAHAGWRDWNGDILSGKWDCWHDKLPISDQVMYPASNFSMSISNKGGDQYLVQGGASDDYDGFSLNGQQSDVIITTTGRGNNGDSLVGYPVEPDPMYSSVSGVLTISRPAYEQIVYTINGHVYATLKKIVHTERQIGNQTLNMPQIIDYEASAKFNCSRTISYY